MIVQKKKIKKKHKCDISIHMDPIETENKTINNLRETLSKIIKNINPALDFHDFRITNGPERTNLIFDLEVPFGFEMKDNDIIRQINREIKKINTKYYVVVKVDKVVVNEV